MNILVRRTLLLKSSIDHHDRLISFLVSACFEAGTYSFLDSLNRTALAFEDEVRDVVEEVSDEESSQVLPINSIAERILRILLLTSRAAEDRSLVKLS